MREIVDKFFPDNWIISIYLGITVDLSIAWSQYPAARSALLNSLQLSSIQNLTTKHLKLMDQNIKDLDQILTEVCVVFSPSFISFSHTVNNCLFRFLLGLFLRDCDCDCRVTSRWTLSSSPHQS